MTNILATTSTEITATTNTNLESLLDGFISSLDTTSERTRDTYRKGARYMLNFLSERKINEPKRENLLEYKNHLISNYSASTANSYLTATRLFFEYLQSEAIYPNVAANIKNIKLKAGYRKDALSAKDAKKVLRNIKPNDLAGARDYAIISLLLHTGMRTIEIQRADFGDIRTKSGHNIIYVQGKGRAEKDEYLKLTRSVVDAINAYNELREKAQGRKTSDEQALFISVSNRDFGARITTRSVSRICKNALRSAGYDSARLTAHSFRHTAATLAIEAGVPIREVQKMTRHADPKTLEIYAHDQKRLTNAAEDALEKALAI